ncbi:MAG TPA: hypothetical protein VK615_16960 [Candidatus Binatia bacterium]|nr:hypothetical protein [Candidatus Binatia bacterium]
MDSLLSVIVGGALALAGGFLTKLWECRREQRALAFALAGEIGAIIDVAERRKYLPHIRETIAKVEAGEKPRRVRIRAEQNYFVVYEANAEKVGLLPRQIARDVARFYTLMKAILEDVTDKQWEPSTSEDALRHLHSLAELADTMLKLGNQVVVQLERIR